MMDCKVGKNAGVSIGQIVRVLVELGKDCSQNGLVKKLFRRNRIQEWWSKKGNGGSGNGGAVQSGDADADSIPRSHGIESGTRAPAPVSTNTFSLTIPNTQVIVSTGMSGSTFTAVVIDVLTGATLSTQKGGWIAQPGTLCQLSGHWAAAELQSPGTSPSLSSVLFVSCAWGKMPHYCLLSCLFVYISMSSDPLLAAA